MLRNNVRPYKKNEENTTKDDPPRQIIDDPLSDYGAEMAKEAQVWKTYVKETDQWDKEMVEGRNNSLDVLLIFAALFSAVSTAFVIESLGDLKPDSTEMSARTLVVISQTLAALASNQPIPTLDQGISDPGTFSPSRSSVVVNVMWLLSLSLSVAVSLIAILAKDWCHKFMSGRSGQAYEQARRRQLLWNGIEKWRMTDMLTYLAGVMHLALFLFAAGLCVYLWDINTDVAVPVILVTALATLLYTCATILPLADANCPYSTPVTHVFTNVVETTRVVIGNMISWLTSDGTNRPKVEQALHKITDGLQTEEDATNSAQSDLEKRLPPMDIVTSQMLAWLLTNCEDARSVDVALQAIAGAKDPLPHSPLAQCGVLPLLFSRLNACAQWDRRYKRYKVKKSSMLPTALSYCRAYSVLMSGDTYENVWHKWKTNSLDAKWYDWFMRTQWKEDSYMTSIYVDLLDQIKLLPTNSSLAVTATSAAMMFSHWSWDAGFKRTAPELANRMLTQRNQGGDAALSPQGQHTLVESAAHYLVALCAREDPGLGSDYVLPSSLTQLFIASFDTAPEVSCAVAVTLAAAAFAGDWYPGGEQPSKGSYVREARAARVLFHYRSNPPTSTLMAWLFSFGIVGLLPRFGLEIPGTEPTTLSLRLGSIMENEAFELDTELEQVGIHTLPPGFSFRSHVELSMCRCLLSIMHPCFSVSKHEPIVVRSCSMLLSSLPEANVRIYTCALISLCRAKTQALRDLCLQVIRTQSIPTDYSGTLQPFDGILLLSYLCYAILSADNLVARPALLHLKLIVSGIIMTPDHTLSERQSVLRKLLQSDSTFTSLAPTIAATGTMGMKDIELHLNESIEGRTIVEAMASMMQLIVNFCDGRPATSSLALVARQDSGDHLEGASDSSHEGWQQILQRIKNEHDPMRFAHEISSDERSDTEWIGSPCWPVNEKTDSGEDAGVLTESPKAGVLEASF